MRKSLVLALGAPAVFLTCALAGLAPAVCSAQDSVSEARLGATTSFAPDEAAASPASAALPAAPASSALPASPLPAGSPEGPRRIGVGAKISLLGIGGEAAVRVSKRINVRGGFNFFNYSDSLSNDGVNYAAKLAFRSGEAHFDFFPFAGGFHLSPGLLFYNDNHIDASAAVGANQSFTLGNASYTSNPANPVMGSASLTFNKVAPSFLIGFGNLIPRNRRRFSFTTDFGVAYTGAPKVAMNFTGSACTTAFQAGKPVTTCVNAATDPNVLSNVQSETAKLNHDVSVVKIYPIASFGFALNF